MIRSHIMLTEAQAAALERAAARQGESMASIIRRAVNNEMH
ncbi:MAG TPA: ribbon-helix-helix protein, CopG family [Chloroflexota bacterium]|jgi:hypothetical protein|nr:ribbon-helix-helix protein, CopG family [Chloroflexota bacterium]